MGEEERGSELATRGDRAADLHFALYDLRLIVSVENARRRAISSSKKGIFVSTAVKETRPVHLLQWSHASFRDPSCGGGW